MKNILLLVTYSILLISASAWIHVRKSKTQPNLAEVSTMPSIQLLKTDSTTIFDTKDLPSGKPTILMYFSPDCEHCHQQTNTLVANIDRLKDVQIVLMTPLSFGEMKAFIQRFGLDKLKNLTVAYDFGYSFYKYFKAEAFPCIVVYDKDKKLRSIYRKNPSMEITINSLEI